MRKQVKRLIKKKGEKCQTCKMWDLIQDVVPKQGKCKSKKRKEEKTIPVNLMYITAANLRACDFWKERKLK